jgi:F0F1-type ATP synthase assembly protein I
MELPPSPKAPQQSVFASLALSVRLAWNLGYLIALPVIILGFGGAYLDRSLGTSPLFVLLGFCLAATMSFFGVKRKVKEILGAVEKN